MSQTAVNYLDFLDSDALDLRSLALERELSESESEPRSLAISAMEPSSSVSSILVVVDVASDDLTITK